MRTHPHFLFKDLFRKDHTQGRELSIILKNTSLFKTLTRRELRYLSTLVYERTYEAEESIFEQSERGFGMYVIAQGKVAIRTQGSEGEVLVTHLGSGSFFGELALIDPNNIRTASAVSLERTVLVGFFKPDLLEIIQRKPEMGAKILLQLSTVLGERLMKTTEKISLLSQARGSTQYHEDVV